MENHFSFVGKLNISIPIFRSYLGLPEGKPWSTSIFPWFSHGFPMVFPENPMALPPLFHISTLAACGASPRRWTRQAMRAKSTGPLGRCKSHPGAAAWGVRNVYHWETQPAIMEKCSNRFMFNRVIFPLVNCHMTMENHNF